MYKFYGKFNKLPAFLAAIFALCSSALNSAATAEEKDPWTYWLGAGAYFTEGDDATEPGQLYEGRVGYDIDDQFTVEFGIGGSPFMESNSYPAPDPREGTFNGKNSPGDNFIVKSNVGLLYHLDSSPDKVIDPYLSVMGGAAIWGKQRRDDDNLAWLGGPGAGVTYWMDKDLAVRADYSMLVTEDSNAEINHQALLMLFYRFGWGLLSGSGSGEGDAKQGMGESDSDLAGKTSAGLKPIYFDFDKSLIKGDSEQTLRDNSEWIKKNPSRMVSLEGHCDERGTVEYNLALGARRSKAAYDYLRSLGVPPEQMTTTSFGEEFPADPGHNEAAWSKNRRVESLAK